MISEKFLFKLCAYEYRNRLIGKSMSIISSEQNENEVACLYELCIYKEYSFLNAADFLSLCATLECSANYIQMYV